MTAGIAYVDGPRLARAMFAAAEWVAVGREDINRINVFPVPDGDTGTNLSLTLRAVADALRALGDASLPDTARAIARGAVLGARGNSGMMVAHFLLGFTDALGTRESANAREIAAAIQQGFDRLYSSLDDPREGTILTVARDTASAADRAAADGRDLSAFMRHMLADSERALARTPELMAVLKEAGVVDAGGKGFVRMIEGIVRYIEGDVTLPAPRDLEPIASVIPAALVDVDEDQDYQFCTEVLVRGEQLPSANEVRSALHAFGGSIQVVVAGDVLKAHVHTDTPDDVFSYAARWGRVESTKAEDMRAQHRDLVAGATHAPHLERRAVAIVADSSADLPDSVLDHHRIALVPLQVTFGDDTFRDRVELKADEFYRRLRMSQALPTTSQPTPADFHRVFTDARHEAEEVVAVVLSSGLSGTYGGAQIALRAGNLDRVYLVDSRSASLGAGMLALRGAELAAEGWRGADIARELERIRDQSGMFLTVDRLDNLLRSGRVSRGKAWLAGLLDLKPILSLDVEGRITPVDRVRGRDQVVQRVLALLDKRLTPRPKMIRFGIAHADAPDVAEHLRQALTATYGSSREGFVTLATGVLGAHVGPGAWGVFYQVED